MAYHAEKSVPPQAACESPMGVAGATAELSRFPAGDGLRVGPWAGHS